MESSPLLNIVYCVIVSTGTPRKLKIPRKLKRYMRVVREEGSAGVLSKAILFDIGGVLLTLGEGEYRQQLAGRLGLRGIPSTYEECVPALQRGELPEEDFWARIAGKRVSATLFDDIWLAHFRPIAGMLDFAAQLRSRGVTTGILSNTQRTHVRMMRSMGFLSDFNPCFLSCEVGMRKPESAIYSHALSKLSLPPTDVAYIDDVPEYVTAARGLGITSILHQGDESATQRQVEEWLDS